MEGGLKERVYQMEGQGREKEGVTERERGVTESEGVLDGERWCIRWMEGGWVEIVHQRVHQRLS